MKWIWMFQNIWIPKWLEKLNIRWWWLTKLILWPRDKMISWSKIFRQINSLVISLEKRYFHEIFVGPNCSNFHTVLCSLVVQTYVKPFCYSNAKFQNKFSLKTTNYEVYESKLLSFVHWQISEEAWSEILTGNFHE